MYLYLYLADRQTDTTLFYDYTQLLPIRLHFKYLRAWFYLHLSRNVICFSQKDVFRLKLLVEITVTCLRVMYLYLTDTFYLFLDMSFKYIYSNLPHINRQ